MSKPKPQLGLLYFMDNSTLVYEAIVFIAFGIAVSPLLMKYGIFTGAELTFLGFVVVAALIHMDIIPYRWIDEHPEIEWCLLILFPIGVLLERFNILSLRPLSTLPATTLPPYSTATEALMANPELLIALVLIMAAVVGVLFKKKR
jgi:hypothetical protein